MNRNTPTKNLIESLRKGEVFLTVHDAPFERFLDDFQVLLRWTNLCRVCLLEERITPLNAHTASVTGVPNRSAPTAPAGNSAASSRTWARMGRQSMSHMEELLSKYRDVDRVLASIQPEQIRMVPDPF